MELRTLEIKPHPMFKFGVMPPLPTSTMSAAASLPLLLCDPVALWYQMNSELMKYQRSVHYVVVGIVGAVENNRRVVPLIADNADQ
jgi:hypothetical protein